MLKYERRSVPIRRAPRLAEHVEPDSIEELIRKTFSGKDGLPGKDGRDGVDGKDGEPGRNGLNGRDGRNGVDGKDGLPGPPGPPGRDGVDGLPGRDGINGRDGRDGQSAARPVSVNFEHDQAGFTSQVVCLYDDGREVRYQVRRGSVGQALGLDPVVLDV